MPWTGSLSTRRRRASRRLAGSGGAPRRTRRPAIIHSMTLSFLQIEGGVQRGILWNRFTGVLDFGGWFRVDATLNKDDMDFVSAQGLAHLNTFRCLALDFGVGVDMTWRRDDKRRPNAPRWHCAERWIWVLGVGVHMTLKRDHMRRPKRHVSILVIDLSERGAARAEDAQGTPSQSHISTSILVYEENPVESLARGVGFRCLGGRDLEQRRHAKTKETDVDRVLLPAPHTFQRLSPMHSEINMLITS